MIHPRLERRSETPHWLNLVLPLAAILATLILCSGLVALAGSLAVGLPPTVLAIGVSTVVTDLAWLRKTWQAAAVNAGREVVAVVAAYGVYAAVVRASGPPPGLHLETLPALFFYALAYFVFTRLLFYFALIVRGKLEQGERLLILRYECIGFGTTLIGRDECRPR